VVHEIVAPNHPKSVEHKAKISAAKKGKLLGKYPEERAKKQRGKRGPQKKS
jgi:hypothetical protein